MRTPTRRLDEEGTRLFVPHLAVQNGAEATRFVSSGYGGVTIEEDTSVASVAVIGVRDEEVLGQRAHGDRVKGRLRIKRDPFARFAIAPAGAPSRQATAAAVLGADVATGVVVRAEATRLAGEARPSLVLQSAERAQPIVDRTKHPRFDDIDLF
jgi:hypothetical protein